MPKLEWRGRELWLGGLWIGQTIQWGQEGPKGHEQTPFRGWLMSEEDGQHTGWFSTEEDAKRDVQGKAEALLGQ